MMPNKYVDFIKVGDEYEVWNIIYDLKVGVIKKARMGRWMHWQLFSDSPKIGFTNGCLREISAFITTLYSKNKQ